VLGACGGDDDDGGGETTAAEDAGCVESFASAPDTLPRLARLSHAEGTPVTVGEYTGAEFSAQVYDETTTGDGVDTTVAPGACVVTELSPDFGPLYLFVEGTDGVWHRLLESDPAVPLITHPETQLEGVEQVEIEAIGA
jgi:hypothetical protein